MIDALVYATAILQSDCNVAKQPPVQEQLDKACFTLQDDMYILTICRPTDSSQVSHIMQTCRPMVLL